MGPFDIDDLKDKAFDTVKDKALDAVSEHNDMIDAGLEKAGDLVNERTGGKFDAQVDTGVEKAQDALDHLGNG